MSQTVPAVRARALIGREIQPLLAGMDLVREGTWARSLTAEVRAVVQIHPLKGAQYDLVYGVCCAWVPKSGTGSTLGRFPRTLKQTALHLWVDAARLALSNDGDDELRSLLVKVPVPRST